MPLVLADRVRETTTTTGTGTISLAGPVSGFQGFSTAIGNANTTYYTIVDAATGAWEVGLGTYTSAGSTLARTTVLSSSNSDALVPFAAGTKDVFVTQPAERAVYVLGAGTGLAAGAAAFTANGVPYADSTSTLTTGSAMTFDGSALAVAGSTSPQLIATESGGLLYAAVQLQAVSAGGKNWTIASNATSSPLGTAGGLSVRDSSVGTTYLNLTTSGLEVTQSQLIGYSSYAGIGTNGLAVAGNVGIGTSSPGYKVDAQGGPTVLRLKNSNSTDNTAIRFAGNQSNADLYLIGTNVGSNGTGANFQFYDLVAAATRLTLDSSGNLGLGVTPSAWGSTWRVLDAGNLSSFVNNTGGSTTDIWHNAFVNNGGSPIYKTTAAASFYRLQGGAFGWFNAPSGTAGNAITFTQAMTLTAGGNLLVGSTATPSSGSSTILAAYATGGGLQIAHVNSGGGGLFAGLGGGGITAYTYTGAVGSESYTERARITSGGDFEVGNQQGTGARKILVQSNTSGDATLELTCGGVDTGYLYFERSTARLYARASTTGGVYLASGGTSWTAVSDERKKDIIEPITDAASKVSTLRAVIGKYKDDSKQKRRSFLIAQDVQAVLPEAVDTSNPDELGLSYSDTIPLLVAAIKELKADLDATKAELAALKGA
jgi:hypothetical protein